MQALSICPVARTVVCRSAHRHPSGPASGCVTSSSNQLERNPLSNDYLQSTRRNTAIAGLALALTSVFSPVCLAVDTPLDLPECKQFKPAGKLQYCDVREGRGPSPEPGDQVEVNYTARLASSRKVYDGSRGFNFTLGNQEVIPGWEMAMVGSGDVPPIKEGGVRTVLISPDLAYGNRGSGCSAVDGRCRVPPDSEVQITFEYVGLGY